MNRFRNYYILSIESLTGHLTNIAAQTLNQTTNLLKEHFSSYSNIKCFLKVNLSYVLCIRCIKFCVNWHKKELLCMESTRNINYYWFTKSDFDLFVLSGFHFWFIYFSFQAYLIQPPSNTSFGSECIFTRIKLCFFENKMKWWNENQYRSSKIFHFQRASHLSWT